MRASARTHEALEGIASHGQQPHFVGRRHAVCGARRMRHQRHLPKEAAVCNGGNQPLAAVLRAARFDIRQAFCLRFTSFTSATSPKKRRRQAVATRSRIS